MNKVITKKKVKVNEDKSDLELRRLNAKFQHEDISETELAHFGVMGMHWGVRNDKSNDTSKLLKDADKEVKKNFVKIYNGMANDMNKEGGIIGTINGEFAKKYGNDFDVSPGSKLEKSYFDKFTEATTASANKHASNILAGKIDPSVKVLFYNNIETGEFTWSITPSENTVEHSDNLIEGKLQFKYIFDKLGRIKIVEKVEEDKESTVVHTGVMGMKWGVRKAGVVDNLKERANRSSMLANKRTISDDDLNKMVKRLEMEKKLKDLTTEDLNPGKKAIQNQMGKFMASAVGAAAGVVGAVLIKQALKKAGIDVG